MVRLVSGVLLAAAFVALIWFASATVLLIVALAVACLAVHEYVQLVRAMGAHIHAVPALLATCAVTIVVPFPYISLDTAVAAGVLVIAIWSMAALKSETSFREAAIGIAAACLAPVYIGLGLGTLVAIHVYGGRGAVLLLVATIVVSDSAQYYSGRTFGRHALAPKLSPKKTIEGAVGGFVLAPVFLVWAAYYLIPAATNQVLLAVLAIGLVVAGIAGDLFESMLKRAATVKDSSALIPGHGGVLDRIDALLFAGPVFLWYLRGLFT
jgi:phosphatidate cytidylyltransferase